MQIRRSALEYQDFFSKNENSTPKPVSNWIPPVRDLIKFNIDGRFSDSDGKGGWGVVARDSDGDVCVSAAGRLDFAQDVLHTEAEACLKAMTIAQEWGMTRVHIETDAQMLVKAVTSKEYDLAPNGVLFREIRAQAFLNFTSFSISFCPRTCNNVADALACYGAKMVVEPQAVWLGRVSTFCQLLVASDIAAHFG